MILKIAIVVCLLAAVVLIVAAAKTDTFHIQRSVSIKASPEKIFLLINDLHNWPRWAPQDREDPTCNVALAAQRVGSVPLPTGAVREVPAKDA